jgi:hypothetical protein
VPGKRPARSLVRGTGRGDLPSVELVDETQVPADREKIHRDADHDEEGSDPGRDAVRLRRGPLFGDLEHSQEQTKSGDDEAKAHEREARADPGEECSLLGKIIL